MGIILIVVILLLILYWAIKKKIKKDQQLLLNEVISSLNISELGRLNWIDDSVVVKSRQALNNYDDIKYIKERQPLEEVLKVLEMKRRISRQLVGFIKDNPFSERKQYSYVKEIITGYINMASAYRVTVEYITSAGNNLANRIVSIDMNRAQYLSDHPEMLMSKGEYNKYAKQLAKDELENKKHSFYERVNEAITLANESRDCLVVKSKIDSLDQLALLLFDKTVNTIARIKDIDSDEWGIIETLISDKEQAIRDIVEDNNMILDYYSSNDFLQIKQTCSNLMQSQREFNEYISEKAESISQLFGTRVSRNETTNEDTFNYVRSYKKTIHPFTVEVSSTVFGSAENNPMTYVVKYFYPNKKQYPEQIEKLRLLIEELETLKEAAVIIENYKADYAQYIKDVPNFVMEMDESGFYSRLGFANIDESVLNVEYKFTYTSDGGMAQRSFTVSMTEENIVELINTLESRLTLAAQAKEQRLLMTSKLRLQIKERDNYTCCQCGNSIYSEPNLLLEIDHIVPISKGGMTEVNNLQTLCWKCNRRKGSKI